MSQKHDLPKQNWETVEYADNPHLPDVEDLRIVDKEFLPRPEELVYKDTETENITVSLDKETVTFFKSKGVRSLPSDSSSEYPQRVCSPTE